MDEKFWRGFAVGVVAGVAIRHFGPSMAISAGPLLRQGMKSAIKGFVQSREAFADLQELAEDAFAEAWAELKSEAETAASAMAADTSTASGRGGTSAHRRTAGKEGSRAPKKRRRPQRA